MQQSNLVSPIEKICCGRRCIIPRQRRRNQGNKYISVIMDYFSKWLEVYPLPTQETATLSEVLVVDWLYRFDHLLECHSDQDRNFEHRYLKKCVISWHSRGLQFHCIHNHMIC